MNWLQGWRGKLISTAVIAAVHFAVLSICVVQIHRTGASSIWEDAARLLGFPLLYLGLPEILPMTALNSVLWGVVLMKAGYSLREIAQGKVKLSVRFWFTGIVGICAITYLVMLSHFQSQLAVVKLAYALVFAERTVPRLIHTEQDRKALLESLGPIVGDVNSISVLPNGSVEIRPPLSLGGRYYLVPRPPSASGIVWDCITPDISWMRYVAVGCIYDDSFKPEAPILAEAGTAHTLYFEFNKSDDQGATPENLEQFEKFVSSLFAPYVRQLRQVEITAYADPVGSSKNNLRVANARAAYVREALVARGVPRDLILARVIGAESEEALKCSQESDDVARERCFRATRRVDIRVKYGIEA
jgi:hypothetical protein